MGDRSFEKTAIGCVVNSKIGTIWVGDWESNQLENKTRTNCVIDLNTK